MLEQLLNCKPQRLRKMKAAGCKQKNVTVVAVPDSWNLSEAQRNFIESLVEKKIK